MTGNNFGCGFSREHAVWALLQESYRVVIEPWKIIDGERVPAFADIFRSNCVKNGLLSIELSDDDVDRIFALAGQHHGLQATVDLPFQKITLHPEEEIFFAFIRDPS